MWFAFLESSRPASVQDFLKSSLDFLGCTVRLNTSNILQMELRHLRCFVAVAEEAQFHTSRQAPAYSSAVAQPADYSTRRIRWNQAFGPQQARSKGHGRGACVPAGLQGSPSKDRSIG